MVASRRHACAEKRATAACCERRSQSATTPSTAADAKTSFSDDRGAASACGGLACASAISRAQPARSRVEDPHGLVEGRRDDERRVAVVEAGHALDALGVARKAVDALRPAAVRVRVEGDRVEHHVTAVRAHDEAVQVVEPEARGAAR